MKDINATVIVDLKPSKEELMRNLHKDARWGINRAIKEGLVVEEVEDGDEKDWKEFYDIYKTTMLEGGSSPANLEGLKEKSEVLFVCKDKDRVIAGAGIWFVDIYDIKTPRLFTNASLKEYFKKQPNNLLYWKCILWAKNKGYEKFDLGGYQLKARGHLEGVNKFKEKWGELVHFQKEYPFLKVVGRKLVRNSSFFWWLNKTLKKS